jgi:hypothetical protein
MTIRDHTLNHTQPQAVYNKALVKNIQFHTPSIRRAIRKSYAPKENHTQAIRSCKSFVLMSLNCGLFSIRHRTQTQYHGVRDIASAKTDKTLNS